MELQVGVKAIIKNQNGDYLLLRRSLEKYPEIGDKWDIVGGRINPGETLFDNLQREIREEIGLELKGDPKLIAAQDILLVPGRHVVRLTYIVDFDDLDGEPRLSDEHSEFKWFGIKELKNSTKFG